MKLRSRKLTLATVALAGLFPAGAVAISPPALVCGKDYSRNSVDGNYCVTRHVTPTLGSPPVSSTPTKVVANDNGFAWGDAAAGAGMALGIVLIGGGTTTAVRRRRTPAQPSRPVISS